MTLELQVERWGNTTTILEAAAEWWRRDLANAIFNLLSVIWGLLYRTKIAVVGPRLMAKYGVAAVIPIILRVYHTYIYIYHRVQARKCVSNGFDSFPA